jgi:Ras-related C3 botulinum toxin substrate 1
MCFALHGIDNACSDPPLEQMRHIKMAVIGEGEIGTNCLVMSYTTNAFPGEYIPPCFDENTANVMVEDQQINFHITRIPPSEEYKKLRPLSYPCKDVFLLLFSLVSPTSLDDIQTVIVPEIKEHCQITPYILVGMQSDLRNLAVDNPAEWKAKGMEPVPHSKGEAIKEAIGAQAYIECSTKEQINVKEVFELAMRVVLHPPPTGKVQETDTAGCVCEVS